MKPQSRDSEVRNEVAGLLATQTAGRSSKAQYVLGNGDLNESRPPISANSEEMLRLAVGLGDKTWLRVLPAVVIPMMGVGM
jgi:hypothetical protein